MIKNLTLVLVTVACSFLFWLKAGSWLNDPFNWQNFSLWFWPTILLGLLVAMLVLSFLLLSKFYWKLTVLALHLGAALFFFGAHRLLLAGTLVGLGLGLLAIKNIHHEKENRFKFSLVGILRGGIYRILTATFIMLSFAYFLTPGVQNAAQKKELPSGLVQVVQVVVGNFMEGGITFSDPSFTAQVNREVMKKINAFLAPYYHYLPPILAFSFFLALQGLGFIFLWVTLLLSAAIFLMLKLFKAIVIKKVMKEAETVSLL